MVMVILCWKSLLTGATGRGKPLFREAAEKLVADLNDRYKGEITHWLEPVSAAS